MKNIFIYCAALLIIILAGFAYARRSPIAHVPSTATNATSTVRQVQLKGSIVRVTIASTPAQRELGLSGRTGLAADEGMLFVFEQDGDYAFWMKDMLFSIDIVWIDASGTVIYIAPSVSPDTYPQAFDPKMNARYVLELPAGYMQSHGIRVGDTVEL